MGWSRRVPTVPPLVALVLEALEGKREREVLQAECEADTWLGDQTKAIEADAAARIRSIEDEALRQIAAVKAERERQLDAAGDERNRRAREAKERICAAWDRQVPEPVRQQAAASTTHLHGCLHEPDRDQPWWPGRRCGALFAAPATPRCHRPGCTVHTLLCPDHDSAELYRECGMCRRFFCNAPHVYLGQDTSLDCYERHLPECVAAHEFCCGYVVDENANSHTYRTAGQPAMRHGHCGRQFGQARVGEKRPLTWDGYTTRQFRPDYELPDGLMRCSRCYAHCCDDCVWRCPGTLRPCDEGYALCRACAATHVEPPDVHPECCHMCESGKRGYRL